MYLSAAIVGVRAFALARAAFRYAERLASHVTALRLLGGVRGEPQQANSAAQHQEGK